jgi:RHS repeat-associated protein
LTLLLAWLPREAGALPGDCVHPYCFLTAIHEPPGDGATTTCPDARGMPVWWVSEPFITLRLEDEPLGYQPARGPRVGFHLSYRQRGNVPPALTGVGPHWSSSFRAFISATLTNAPWESDPAQVNATAAIGTPFDPEAPVDPTPIPTEVVSELNFHRVGAGYLRYQLQPGYTAQHTYPHSMDGSTVSVLTGDCPEPDRTATAPPGAPAPATRRCVLGFHVDFRDGARATFMQRLASPLDPLNALFPTVFLITSWSDPAGLSLTFHYDPDDPGKLLAVTDADGLATVLGYSDPRFPNQITSVTDPYLRTCLLEYDAQGYLTRVVDVAQLASSFTYDTAAHPGPRRGWITNLTTPYGPTSFRHGGPEAETEQAFFTGGGVVNRFIEVLEPTGSRQLYVYRHVGAGAPDETQPPMPHTYGLPNTLESGFAGRNSFHWGRLQHAHLSANYRTTGDPAQLQAGDYAIARLRHWLRSPNERFPISDVLSSERLPSPDGVAPGAWTWFDYAGKYAGLTDMVGTHTELAKIARWLSDAEAEVTHFARNSRGLVLETAQSYTATDGAASLRWVTNTYNYRLDLVAQHGPNGELLRTNLFNGWHQLTAAADALGQWTYYEYDPAYRQLTNVIHPGGRQTSLRYDSQTRRLAELWDTPAGRWRQFTHGAADGLPQTVTDERGLALTFHWDALQRPTRVEFPDTTFIEHQYRHLDRVATRDRLGHWTRADYNALRQPTYATNSLGAVTALDWCGCGSLRSAIAGFGTPLAETNSFTYDLQGRLQEIRWPDQTTETHTYDYAGRLVAWTDSLVTRTFHYNLQGLLTEVFNGAGREGSVTYDEFDRPRARTDASGVTTAYTYDLLGRLVAQEPVGGAPQFFGYTHGVSRPTSHWDPLGQETTFQYDLHGRLTQQVNRNQETTSFTYDASGLLVALEDGRGLTTQWRHDEYGRLTNKLDQAGAPVLRLTYDANGRLVTRWTPAKGTTVFQYNALGQTTRLDYPASPDVVLRYNLLGRLTNLVDAVGLTAFQHHRGGSLSQETGPWANSQLTNTYHLGRRTALRLTQPGGAWTNGFTYDLAGRLAAVVSPAGPFDYRYADGSASPLLTGIGLPNGAQIAYEHDALSRLTGTALWSAGGALLNAHTYTHDDAHRRTSQTRTDASSVAYEYDPLGQLTGALGSGGLSPEVLGYDYDASGNLTWRGSPGGAESFLADTRNQLTASTPTGANTYDPNGNLLTSHNGQRQYTCDDENRLTRLTTYTGATPQTRSEFSYDGFGRLRVRREYVWVPAQPFEPEPYPIQLRAGGGRASASAAQAQIAAPATGTWNLTGETRYLYDGWRVIQERNANNVPQVSYTRGLDLSGSLEGAGGIGGLLARSVHPASGIGHPTSAYYHGDGAGNVTALLAPDSTLAARYGYDPFGNQLWQSGPLADANRHRFSSKELHPASGLYYYGHRFYDPRTQRWLNRDPLGEAGGVNLYGFVGNAPANAVDALGLQGHFHLGAPPTVDPQQHTRALIKAGAHVGLLNPRADAYITQLRMDGAVLVEGVGRTIAPFSLVTATIEAGSGENLFHPELVVNRAYASEQMLHTGYDTLLAFSTWPAGRARVPVPCGVGPIPAFTKFPAVERQTIARIFYSSATTWSDSKIALHLRGIDFNQPVSVVTLPAGTSLIQYQFPRGRIGNYFAPPGTPAHQLGIYTSGLVGNSYVLPHPVQALQSTAASVIDDWSMSGFGWRIQTQGGGPQFFIPNGASAVGQ